MEMTPSEIKNMIDKAVANYRALLEKHVIELSSEAVQIVLERHRFAEQQFQIFRTRVETISNFIIRIRKVKVNRNRTPQQAIDATGRTKHLYDEVVREMPMGEGEEVEVYLIFFKKQLSDDTLEQEVDKAGFVLIDPITLNALNEQDPALADTIPNATQWRDKNGKACFACFRYWGGKRRVYVLQYDNDCHIDCFFGCVHKKSTQVSES